MTEKIIMIVDDDDDVRDSFAALFDIRFPGMKIIQAQNGREAADKLEELLSICLPNAIMTDFDMPVMNGLELLKFIRNHSNPQIKNLRAVMLTGIITRRLQESTKELDCPLFEKPVRFAEISSALISEK